MSDLISRENALFCLTGDIANISIEDYIAMVSKRIKNLPPEQPEKRTEERTEGDDNHEG